MRARHAPAAGTLETARRPGLHALVVVLAILLWVSAASAASFEGRVVGISDGDTIEVLHGGRGERIRLYGIDCPEKRQAFGQAAKRFASDLAFGKTVTVEVRDRDRYGRTVGEVILPGGRSLNRELVREGFAWWYRQYSSDRTLGELEAHARGARAGLWADPAPLAPWEFRHGAKHPLPSAGTRAETPDAGVASDDTVFVAPTGKGYHRAGCPTLQNSWRPISRDAARSRGLTPCGACNPP